MEIKLVFNFTKANTVSNHRVMSFFKRRVGVNQGSRREESGAFDTEMLMPFSLYIWFSVKAQCCKF